MKVLELKSNDQIYVVTGLTDSEVNELITGIKDIKQRLKEELYFLHRSPCYTLPIDFTKNPKISVYSTKNDIEYNKVEPTSIQFHFCPYPQSEAKIREIPDSVITNATCKPTSQELIVNE